MYGAKKRCNKTKARISNESKQSEAFDQLLTSFLTEGVKFRSQTIPVRRCIEAEMGKYGAHIESVEVEVWQTVK